MWAAHQNWVSWMPYNVNFETSQLRVASKSSHFLYQSSFLPSLSIFKLLTEQHYLSLIRPCFYAIMQKFPSGINKGCLSRPVFDMVWNSLHLSCWQNTNHIFIYLQSVCPPQHGNPAHMSPLFVFSLSFQPLFYFHTGDYECVMSWLELVSALCALLHRVRNHSLSENNWA